MSDVTQNRCDHCGKIVANRCEQKGWIHFYASASSVSVSRSAGYYGQSAFVSDYLSNVTDFCGVECLVAALDAQIQKREVARRTCVACGGTGAAPGGGSK